MTIFLLKRFIKNYTDVQNKKVREQYGMLGGIVGIVCNIILFVCKLVLGLIANSVAVMTDSFNNLSDVGSSVVTMIGAKAGNKPADEKHPFGHGRIEYIAGLVVSFIILFIGLQFLITSVKKIFSPDVLQPSAITFVILALTVAVKIWLSLFNKRLGKAINSSALTATSLDALTDVVATSATIISLVLFSIWNINIDAYIGCLVAFAVLYAGFNVLKETSSPLIGESVDLALADNIKQKLLSYTEIIGCHDLVVHNYGPNKSMASIHAEVPDNLNIHQIHNIIDLAEREISDELSIVIVIHMDPVPMHDANTKKYKSLVSKIITALDSNVTMHDFRIATTSPENIELIFDIEIPYSYDDNKQNKLVEKIKLEIKRNIDDCSCIINIDKSFISTK